MIVCVDVHYGVTAVTTALVGWIAWPDAAPACERVDRAPPDPAPYVPGAFYQRELPYLVAIIAHAPAPVTTIVVDGHVWLGPDRPGLGVHVHARFDVPVIGVAKSAFVGAPSLPVVRGASARPLHVTAIGVAPAVAAAQVAAMHGPFRLPTLLKRADALARGHR